MAMESRGLWGSGGHCMYLQVDTDPRRIFLCTEYGCLLGQACHLTPIPSGAQNIFNRQAILLHASGRTYVLNWLFEGAEVQGHAAQVRALWVRSWPVTEL